MREVCGWQPRGAMRRETSGQRGLGIRSDSGDNLRLAMKRLACLVVAELFASAVMAGPRISASYSIAAETVSAGGQPATSASYTMETSTGEIGSFATAATSAVTAKTGFVGQLFDIAGTAITASTSTLAENGTLALAAWQVLDDASFLALPPTAPTWSVVSGPITAISPNGVATAATVYQDTPATVRATFAGFGGTLGITVANTNVDDLPGYSGDGLDDAWQVQYFGLNNPLAAPDADASGTGQTNLLKFAAGLDPLDPNARFVVSTQPAAAGQRTLVISPRYDDRIYTLYGSEDLLTWLPVTGSITDLGTTRLITDPNANLRKFYKVTVIKP